MRTGARRTATENGGTQLGMYDVAFLAGREERVVDSAVIALAERGLVVVSAARVRALGDETPEQAVERAVFTSCPRSRSIAAVRRALEHSSPVEEIGRRLSARGLLSRSGRRLTRRGRRMLKAAARDDGLPSYVLEGPTALRPGPVRRGVMAGHTVPAGLGRHLVRMGKALDDEGPDTSAGSDGGFGCGGGGGGSD
ncbi:TIGR04222 domain-containing membrane protein [Streptomyces cinnabarinus]|uniref:TIGR04222 domain-containing membrane protein n=1 Tax=Streptomyces cinnabarinus TaxID=67287 RepID=A0ABY7KRM0_9ACTN|nr:TIGR04222 domain-containing membrane protein [Streptomyces cinnabarinus]WAZ25747.1 TIGR04222 domain-containing membrane protein [Streptomyces cinnabarinus]